MKILFSLVVWVVLVAVAKSYPPGWGGYNSLNREYSGSSLYDSGFGFGGLGGYGGLRGLGGYGGLRGLGGYQGLGGHYGGTGLSSVGYGSGVYVASTPGSYHVAPLPQAPVVYTSGYY